MERYDIVKDIGSGNFGVAKLVRDKFSKELFAVKFIERGQKRITMEEIKNHYWFLKNLPVMSERSPRMNDQPSQTEEEIVWIIQEARKPIAGASGLSGAGGSGGSSSGAVGSSMDLDDLDIDYDDIDTGDFVL
ncbi:hypothetical protein IGI04_029069 [Brassica rapa subsp. trilocularis]|uniref:Protein kinase domain-containing protein n=1 Tax=Brassica rapa subsp. trilocularis TaxID=1813537 RepID=A0ABQ7L3N9_BRACM|nr:hypothetical protein IGI04_029069 [Brassica rapa subsp. trilocularis]